MIYLLKKPKFFGQQLRLGHWSTKDLVFYWRGIEAGNAVDESLSRNHGTITGATWAGRGLAFDGDDYVSIPDKDEFTMNDGLTVIADIYPTTINTEHVIVSKYFDDVPFNGEWLFELQSDGTIFAQCLDDASTNRIRITSSVTLSVNNWYQVAWTYDGFGVHTGLKLYKNGILDTSASSNSQGTFTAMSNYTANVDIGAGLRDSAFAAWFIGTIDGVSIYNRVLSASEIQQLYINPDLPIQIESPKSIFYGISGIKNYSRGDEAALPGNDDNLETSFTSQDYTDVEVDDEIKVSQSASGEYAIFLFKNKNDSQENITLNWNGQSDRAPSASTVYLQIYNKNSTTWENLDSDNTTGANTDFDLNGTQSANLSNYFDADFWISWRVYQQAT